MKPKIEILKDEATVARCVADKLVKQARRAIAERGRFTLALTGGDSPVPLYRMLAEDPAYSRFSVEKDPLFLWR